MSRRKAHTVLVNIIPDSKFLFSNILLRSPILYSMMERRFLYKLAANIKDRYNELGLSARENWDNLIFRMHNSDLADIGGKRHVKQTYKVVRSLADRSIVQFFKNEKGEIILGYFHWIDAFNWNTHTQEYTVRVSPELYDYVVRLTNNFSGFDLNVGIQLNSLYSQKFYELCCIFTSGRQTFRFADKKNPSAVFKERVVRFSWEGFRFMFGLSEYHDPLTGDMIGKEKYANFNLMEERILQPAQSELYQLYKNDQCNAWFDYSTDRSGRGRGGGTVRNVYIYFYTHDHPKSEDALLDRPWQKGDEPLSPYETNGGYHISRATSKRHNKEKIVELTLFDNCSCDEEDDVTKENLNAAQNIIRETDDIEEETAKSNKDDIDFKSFQSFFNESVKEKGSSIRKIMKMTTKRETALKARVKEYDKETVILMIEKAINSDFLNGRASFQQGKPFIANIDWLLNPNNFIKVIEGNYDNRTISQTDTVTHKGTAGASGSDYQHEVETRRREAQGIMLNLMQEGKRSQRSDKVRE